MCLKRPIHTKTKGFFIDPEYADDLTLAGTNNTQVHDTEKIMTKRLTEYNLKVNETKKEKYKVPRPPTPPPTPPTIDELLQHKENGLHRSELDWLVNYKPPEQENPHPDWKKCKLLGSLLDTDSDIERRKALTLSSIQAFQYIYNSKRIGMDLKVRTFNVYSASVFLYNSELWTLTDTQLNNIDSFHRRLLRKVVNIRWPKLISYDDLYEKVGVE